MSQFPRIPEDFDSAVMRFQDFLNELSLSRDITWVFQEDVGMLPNYVAITTPIPSSNRDHAKRLYEYGRAHGACVRLTALCSMPVYGRFCVFFKRKIGQVTACLVEVVIRPEEVGLSSTVMFVAPQRAQKVLCGRGRLWSSAMRGIRKNVSEHIPRRQPPDHFLVK